MDGMRLPKFAYYLDDSDPDIFVLLRQDGSWVAAFSARGATRKGIVEAAEGDYRALLKEHADSLRRQEDNGGELGALLSAQPNLGERRFRAVR